MAIQKETKKATKTRRITICRTGFARQSGYAFFPVINLMGKWLQDSGFRSGLVVDIAYSAGKLVITIAKEQRLER